MNTKVPAWVLVLLVLAFISFVSYMFLTAKNTADRSDEQYMEQIRLKEKQENASEPDSVGDASADD